MEQKKCLACKELIDIEALKCYRCRQLQTPISNINNKASFQYIVVVLIACLIGWFVYEVVTLSGSKTYSDYIVPSEFELHISQVKDTTTVSCFSKLTNISSMKWSNISLVANFYSSNGKIIDLHT